MKPALITLILGVSLIEYSVFSFCCYALFCQINDKPLSKRLDQKRKEKIENERCITSDDSVFFHLLLYRLVEENQR